MQGSDLLNEMGGLQALARELGVDEARAANAAEELLPAILGGFKQQAKAQPAGLAGLAGMLGRMGGGSLLDQVQAPRPTDISAGNEVLSQIFGSKDVSRTVAQHAAGRSGLDSSIVKKMLPMLAMMVAGYMSKQGGVGASQGKAQSTGGLGGMLGQALGGGSDARSEVRSGGLGSMLDMDGDGNPLNDILRMAGKLRGR